MTDDDNSNVGRVYAHRKADLGKDRPATARLGVSGVMFLAVMSGGFLGYMLGLLIAPPFAIALAIGASMSFGAVAVAVFLMKTDQPDEYANGASRTEEEVRAELARIKGDTP